MTDRNELERLLAAATPGPWAVCTDATGDTFVASMADSAETVCEMGAMDTDEGQAQLEADAALIVNLRNSAQHYLSLMDEVERLRRAGQQLLEACYRADALEELPEHIDGSLLDAMRLAIWPEIWTDEQVAALNAYQDRGDVHPFTCGGDRFDEAHKAAQEEHGGDFGQLVATRQGWVCNACDYRQFWAHDFMFDQALGETHDN